MSDKHLSFGVIEDNINRGKTTIDNIFLNIFMPNCFSPIYSNVYMDGLMRCFGQKTSHFTSINTIAEHFGITERSLQEIYKYWESVSVSYPAHENADNNGCIQLIRRTPRYLKYNPGEIQRTKGQINELKNKKKSGPLTDEDAKLLKDMEVKLNLMLSDYSTECSGEYKYQSSNAIEYLTDLRGLPPEIIMGLYDSMIKVNELKDTKKRKSSKEKEQNQPSEGGEHVNTPGDAHMNTPPDEHVNTPGGEHVNTQINTNSILTTNIDNKNKYSNKSVNKNNNDEIAMDLIEGQTDISEKDIDEFNLLLENYELDKLQEQYTPYISAVRSALMDMFFSPTTTINKKKIPQNFVREEISQLNLLIIEHALNKFIKSTKEKEVKNAKAYLKSCIYNSISELNLDIQAKVNFDMNNFDTDTVDNEDKHYPAGNNDETDANIQMPLTDRYMNTEYEKVFNNLKNSMTDVAFNTYVETIEEIIRTDSKVQLYASEFVASILNARYKNILENAFKEIGAEELEIVGK